MKRNDIEILASGVHIDWSSHKTVRTESGKQNYQRKIRVSCSRCKRWRWVNSASLWQIRKGKQKLCWECHKKTLGRKNNSGKCGIRRNTGGYIIRTLCSFSQEEIEFLAPMFRSPNKQKRKSRTEILEHRAIMALHLGRALTSDEIVHHKNGVKDDNRIENLEVKPRSEHTRDHLKLLEYINNLNKKIEILEEELSQYKAAHTED